MHGDDRKAFDTLVVLVVWLLWNESNNRTFQNSNLLASDLVLRILEEGKVWAHAGFKHLQRLFPDAGGVIISSNGGSGVVGEEVEEGIDVHDTEEGSGRGESAAG